MHVVLSNVLLLMIKSKCNIWKNFVVFADDFLCIKRCILKTAHVSHWTVFDAFFWVTFISLIFLTWLIVSEWQWSNRRCLFQSVVFAVIFLCNYTALTNFLTERYFKKDNLWRFFISHIIVSNVLFISVFLYISHIYLCFLRRVTKTKITSIDEI